jgi:2-keto-4-pentenoate hydratase/2-oxohepta-3-ene-1,7-dioic acid hydratase in catechol pathway
MKIICVDKSQNIHLKPDTALLRNNRPFFIPDFSTDIRCHAEIVVRIDRLGKNIHRRFARRYYNEITVGLNIFAADMLRDLCQKGLPWENACAFDNSAVVGDFIHLDSLNADIESLPFRLNIDEKQVQQADTADFIFAVDMIIERISRYFTLRTGDLMFTGAVTDAVGLTIGNRVEGFLCGKKILETRVK